jgi:formate dehydrogenase maturation protein FdhE
MSDNLGSAKIAIIAIDRSVAALSAMYSAMPESEDDYLKFLAILSQIKKQMLETFPNAMDFKRPGFDD